MAGTQNRIAEWAVGMTREIAKAIHGKDETIQLVLATAIAGGHVLLEDVPGVGKTILARALSAALSGEFRRIQCTPDLMPADVIGVSIYRDNTGTFEFVPGPIVGNIVLADEINRATPRTQSAFLEAMERGKISVDGTSRDLPAPFFLLATQNPLEFDGTFPLPEAQRDRFGVTISLGYPHREAEETMLASQRRTSHPVDDVAAVSSPGELIELRERAQSMPVDDSVRGMIVDLARRTRSEPNLEIGASPRASIAMFRIGQALAAVRGEETVGAHIVAELAPAVLRSRVAVRPEAAISGVDVRSLVDSIVHDVMKRNGAGV